MLSHRNLGKGTNPGFEMAIDQQNVKKWNYNGSFLWHKNQIDPFHGTSLYPGLYTYHFGEQKRYAWNLKMNSNTEHSRELILQATAVDYAPDIIPQGKINDQFSFDFGLKKMFGNGKTEVNRSVTDLFNTFGIRKPSTEKISHSFPTIIMKNRQLP